MMSLPHPAYRNQLAIPNETSSSSESVVARADGLTRCIEEHRPSKQSRSTNEKMNAGGGAKVYSDAKRKRAKLPSTPKEKERRGRKKKDAPPLSPHLELGPYDVISGRSSSAFNNVGNRRFRVTMSLNLKQYMEAPTRQDKSLVIISIARMIKIEQGGRFFIQKAKSGIYVEMNEQKIREKIGHALRDLAGAAKEGGADAEKSAANEKGDQPEGHDSSSQESSSEGDDMDETFLDPLPLNSLSWAF